MCTRNIFSLMPLSILVPSDSFRTWDVFNGKNAVETLQHSHDVLAVAFRPDGKQLAASTLDGTVTFWNPQEGDMQVRVVEIRVAR